MISDELLNKINFPREENENFPTNIVFGFFISLSVSQLSFSFCWLSAFSEKYIHTMLFCVYGKEKQAKRKLGKNNKIYWEFFLVFSNFVLSLFRKRARKIQIELTEIWLLRFCWNFDKILEWQRDFIFFPKNFTIQGVCHTLYGLCKSKFNVWLKF